MALTTDSVDVKALKIYQQIFIYIVPIVTNLGFVNGVVVVVRLRWFSKRFKDIGTSDPQTMPYVFRQRLRQLTQLQRRRGLIYSERVRNWPLLGPLIRATWKADLLGRQYSLGKRSHSMYTIKAELIGKRVELPKTKAAEYEATSSELPSSPVPHISFAPDPRGEKTPQKGIYIPGPRERDG